MSAKVLYQGKEVTLRQLSELTGKRLRTLTWMHSEGIRGEDLWRPALERRAEKAVQKAAPSLIRRGREQAKREQLRAQINQLVRA